MNEYESFEQNETDLCEEYESLLLYRDALCKEAANLHITFTREFGLPMMQAFEKKIDCIAKKKTLAYMQMCRNKGLPVNSDELRAHLDLSMAPYQDRLEGLRTCYELAENAKLCKAGDVLRCKTLYRQIAKSIHPDIFPDAECHPELMELWLKAEEAYQGNDVKVLEEVLFLTEKTLRALGRETLSVEVPDIEEKIADLQEEIEMIKRTAPYTYKELLSDPKKKEAYLNDIFKEIEDYIAYEEELDRLIAAFAAEEGVVFTWKMKL